MKNIHIKLVSVILALVLSVSVAAASSYAWMVLSGNPAVSGIQVGIGGGNTVLIAPDIQEEGQDGSVYHYPGHFSDKMNFGQQDAYEYLQQIGNLNPVSTVNGVDWILPTYYTGSDDEVQQGIIPGGTIKDITDFIVDSELIYANLPAEEEDKIEKGHYVYMDFWVVSPASDYKLRVSTGVDEPDGGSFVIDLPRPVAEDGGYILEAAKNGASSAIRVGFLANALIMTDDTMSRYVASQYFDDRFTHLKGLYQEPDTGTAHIDANRFTIYEPNGDAHPADPDAEGRYAETKPLGLKNGEITEKGLRYEKDTFLTVQRRSTWAVPADSEVSAIEQRFQTALYAGSRDNLSLDEIADRFYSEYLQGQISPYVSKGAFVRRTDNLYARLESGDGSLEDEKNGATDDVYIIELERNVPQRIRMFLWLEGQDMDCVTQIAASGFAVNIELACGDE